MFSMGSELTPRAPIPDSRKAQFMQPCSMRDRVSEHLGQNELCVRNNLFSDCQGLVVAKNEMTPQNLFTSKLSGTLTAAKVSLLNSSSQVLPRPNKCGLGLQSDTLVKDGAAFALEVC